MSQEQEDIDAFNERLYAFKKTVREILGLDPDEKITDKDWYLLMESAVTGIPVTIVRPARDTLNGIRAHTVIFDDIQED